MNSARNTFVNSKAQKAGDALRDWDGAADVILASRPTERW
jgi:hypothetical protein